MAIFRAALRTFSRGKGETSTAAAAYRAAVNLRDERTGVTHRFARKKGVESVQCFAPAGAPAWCTELARLWNAAEAAETRSNSRVARELVVSLPHELSAEQRIVLATDIARDMVERYGIGAMLAIHAPDAKGDQRNHHCHIMLTTRELTPAGFGKKVRCLDDQKQGPQEVEYLRSMVEERTNTALAAAGMAERVDRRSLEAQSLAAEEAGDFDRAAELAREPTLLVGRVQTAAARRGERSERLDTNASIRSDNARDLKAYLARVRGEGRLLPSTSDQRTLPTKRVRVRSSKSVPAATSTDKVQRVYGRGARVLNEQAALVERSMQELQRMLERDAEDLARDLRRSQDVLDAYLRVTRQEQDRALWAQRCADDSELIALLREYLARRSNMARAQQLDKEAQRNLHAAVVEREREQHEGELAVPPRWNIAARRQWKTQHVAKAARLRRAVLREQRIRMQVRSNRESAAVSGLRRGVGQAEEAIRVRLRLEPHASAATHRFEVDCIPQTPPRVRQ